MNRPHSPIVHGAIAALLSVLGFSFWATATAATYRCQAGNDISYSDRPCPSGHSGATVNIDPANPDEADKAAALRRARDDAAQLKRIEAQRDKELKQASAEDKKSRREKDARTRSCARIEMKVKHAREDLANATPHEEAKRRTKLKRAEEEYAAECR